MKDKRLDDLSEECTSEKERNAYYRACIAEFQQLGYQEQYLAQLTDDLVPVLGVNPSNKNT
ncbi:hypothetical protein NQU47_12625 [Pseudoalteromonas distincta]|uniref:hypothetical protein n=1 Tax=Pseudoalteromonas distincta TaxID=77608 RepID=UPI0011F3F551|nr:hypothetical protein [Pseudoalteromonas distincta]KAA1158430.1 hypothetical protein EU511_13905 [Pseudoalteromonas distincta]MDC3213419.1 hypothetical protein [Pseudoalteromonas distincta]